MLLLVKFIIVSVYIFFVSKNLFGQESPYYQKPENRKNSWETTALPNLDSYIIKYYLAAHGSFRKDYVNDQYSGGLNKEVYTNLAGVGEFNLGVNRNEKYMFETGFIYIEQNLNSFYDLQLPFQNAVKTYLVPLRIKRSILTLDKVSKTGYLMAGAAINTKIYQDQYSKNNGFYEIRYNGTPKPGALESVSYSLGREVPRFQYETMVEIRGKVTERFELGLFFKVNYSPNHNLSNNITFKYFDGKTQSSSDQISNFGLNFGISARLNSPRYVKYFSKVE